MNLTLSQQQQRSSCSAGTPHTCPSDPSDPQNRPTLPALVLPPTQLHASDSNQNNPCAKLYSRTACKVQVIYVRVVSQSTHWFWVDWSVGFGPLLPRSFYTSFYTMYDPNPETPTPPIQKTHL